MPASSALGDVLAALFERPALFRRFRDKRSLRELCQALMSEKTEVSTAQIAGAALNRYAESDRAGKAAFFRFLNDELDVDADAIAKLAQSYANDRSPKTFRRLARASEPGRQELLRRLNQVPGATAELVRMRSDLLAMLKESPDLAKTDHDFVHLLRSWFNRGFLVLRQITWDSPASVLEKIIAYEAVHEIHTWADLRRRLHPADRRCFAFFHPAMPDEPLIFVEVALVKGVPSSIQEVLSDDRKILGEDEADAAVFYSISNCQQGLAGISFGNSLIKQVVRDLSRDLPNLKSFVTLSPVPGLVSWLKEANLLTALDDKVLLKRLAARYLLEEKDRNGRPRDPVARFHLGNGALIHAVHTDADLSQNGLAQSGGVMVNYMYDLERIYQNLQRFEEKGEIAATSSIKALARHAPRPAPA